jgi:uncharacterized protein (DUF1800 family)
MKIFWKLLMIAIVVGCAFPSPGWSAELGTDPRILHVLNRLAYGPRPGDMARVEAIGVERYLQEQLRPETIAEPESLRRKLAAYQTLSFQPMTLLNAYAERQKMGQTAAPEAVRQQRRFAAEIPEEAVEAKIVRSLESSRQLQEVLVNFWFNHFNVFIGKGRTRFLVGSYEEQAIRPYVLGRFRDLLGATAKHPAMLFYLDNWQNTDPQSPGTRGRFQGINENYARELMELHTLGVNGGYTQQDVTTLARIFTGWGLAKPNANQNANQNAKQNAKQNANSDASGFYFDRRRHDRRDKVFLGQKIVGGGQEEGEKALDILARHPKTAQWISYKLAQYFIADRPPAALVDRLAQTYLNSDGNLRTVVTALVQSPEFWQPTTRNAKFKTPYEYVISAVRATGQSVENPKAIAAMLQQLGMPVYGRQTPDGYPNTQALWLNPEAMTRRLSFATQLGMGKLPLQNSMNRSAGSSVNVDAIALRNTLGNHFSRQTQTVIAESPESLRSALILGSPELMWR